MKLILLALGCLSTAFSTLSADRWVKTYALDAYGGPEIYDILRTKEGGAEQSGVLYGVRLGYEHICRYKLYWGMDALWASGILDGKNQDSKLRSRFTDMNLEARVGYTFQCKNWHCASITPFTGVGYFWENNDYKHPTPLHIHFRNRFAYVPLGFLSQIFISSSWSIGMNFKARILFDSKVRLSNDPDHEDQTQHYEDKPQYRVELPLTYYHCWRNLSLAVSLVPFYEYRQYGHRANFPFDFLETKLRLYGVTLKALYLF